MLRSSSYARFLTLGLLAVLSLCSTSLYAQFWESMGGPAGSYLGPAIVCPNGDLYVTSEGIFRSRDNGTTWQHVAPHIQMGTWTYGASTPSGTVCILTNGELIRSQDNGATWAKLRSFNSSAKMTITPAGQVHIVSNDTLYSSANEGTTWGFITLLPELKGGYIYSDHDNVLYVVAPANYAPYRSLDNGVSWEQVQGMTWGDPWFCSIRSGLVMAAVRTELYFSTDSGKVWRNADFPGNSYINSIHSIGDTIFVADDSGIQKSLNGMQWEPYDIGYPPDSYSGTFLVTDKHLFYWSPFALSRYNGKAGWRNVSPATGMVHLLAATNTGGVVAATKDVRGTGSLGMKLWSINDSMIWQNVVNENGLSALSSDSSGQISAVTMYGFYKYASKPNSNWETGARFSGSLFYAASTKDFHYIVSAAKGFYRSSDNGATWDSLTSGPPNLFLTAIATADPGPLYVAGDKIFYRSSDFGATWEEPVLPFITESGPARAIVAHDSVVIVAADRTGVYFSSDYGTLWENHSVGLPSDVVLSLVNMPNGDLFLATTSGVYEYQQSTKTWSSVIDSLNMITVLSLTVGKDGRLYAGTDGDGVYRSVKSYFQSDVSRKQRSIEDAITVAPNPTTTRLRINFTGVRPGAFSAIVYNVLGERVLISENEDEVDVATLSAGQYFIRVDGGEKNQLLLFVKN